MDIRHLRSFVNAAELGSFTRAAELLGVTQAAIMYVFTGEICGPS